MTLAHFPIYFKDRFSKSTSLFSLLKSHKTTSLRFRSYTLRLVLSLYTVKKVTHFPQITSPAISPPLVLPAHPSHNRFPAKLFYHILEYIDTHSAEPLEVQQLAEMCHMSYSNFARLFRENYGRSCKEYIKYIRLNKAQDLLLNSDYDLDYIAQETGFFDCSHFIRTYKKWRGITPKQERMQNRKVL